MKNRPESPDYVQTCFIIDSPMASIINEIFRLARENGAIAEEVLPYKTESDKLQSSVLYGQTADQLNRYYQRQYDKKHSQEGGFTMGLEREAWERRAKLALECGRPIVRLTFNKNNNDLSEFESTMWAKRKSRKKFLVDRKHN